MSDRDPKFTSKFWKCLMELCGLKLKMSSNRHPQTDGSSEIMNRISKTIYDSIAITIKMVEMNFFQELDSPILLRLVKILVCLRSKSTLDGSQNLH